MGRAAELFALVNCEVSVAAHDRAHFNGAILPFALCVLDLHHGRECLAADFAGLLIDDIVVIALFLQVHSHARTCGAAADDADALILVFHG